MKFVKKKHMFAIYCRTVNINVQYIRGKCVYFPLQLVNITKLFLENRAIRVRQQDSLSRPLKNAVGILQGSCFSTFFFSLYINDMPSSYQLICRRYYVHLHQRKQIPCSPKNPKLSRSNHQVFKRLEDHNQHWENSLQYSSETKIRTTSHHYASTERKSNGVIR